jgi:hypothetical protein
MWRVSDQADVSVVWRYLERAAQRVMYCTHEGDFLLRGIWFPYFDQNAWHPLLRSSGYNVVSFATSW